MSRLAYAIIIDNPQEIESVISIAQSEGLKPKRLRNVVVIYPTNETSMLGFLHEIDVEVLKSMKLIKIDADMDLSCENILKFITRMQSPAEVLDELIYKEIGGIFLHTKIAFHAIADVKEAKVFAFESLCRPPLHIVDLLKVGKSTARFSDAFCREAAIKRASSELPKDVKLFLNFHPRFFENPLKDFGELIATLLTYEVEPDRIVVELTEYEELELDAIKNLISFLKTEGVMVALDDIGSGYSGLFYLSELKPDIIKIDMELIRNIHKDDFKKVIVSHLIEIAHQNGIKVVSEGVETQEELKQVVLMDTDYIQGYLISKPSESVDIKALNERVKEVLKEIT
jgi:EAL domain-containing protein (putative c-di-GMP-specific phosphodiesterase class I)